LAQFSRIPEMDRVMGLTCVGDLHHTVQERTLFAGWAARPPGCLFPA